MKIVGLKLLLLTFTQMPIHLSTPYNSLILYSSIRILMLHGVQSVFILGFLLWRGIKNVGGDH